MRRIVRHPKDLIRDFLMPSIPIIRDPDLKHQKIIYASQKLTKCGLDKMRWGLTILGFVGIILISMATSSFALSFDFDPEINLSENSGDSSESKFTSNGSDVFVVWKDNTSGTNNILFKKSSNDGTSSDSTITIDSGVSNSQSPQISSTNTNVYSVWQEGTSPGLIAFAKSSDSGDSFGTQVILSSMSSTSEFPQIESGTSDVYVAWQQSDNILFTSSEDFGENFKIPIILNSQKSEEPIIGVSGSNVYLLWIEENDISFIKSSNGGTTFSSVTNLSNSATVSSDPQFVSSGNDIYAVWKEGTNIFFTKTTNNGDSFSTPLDVGDTGGTSSPDPKIAVDGSSVYLVWSKKISGSGDIIFAKSLNNGDSFDSPVNLSNNGGNSKLPELSASSGKLSVSWQDNTFGNDEVFLKSSENNGSTFGSTVNISSNDGFSLEPLISLIDSTQYVLWEDTTPDGGVDRDILFVTGTESPISISFDKDEYTLNETAQITVSDSTSSGSIDVSITSTSDATGLHLTLTETGIGTGVFQGTATFGSESIASTIEAKAGDTITTSFGSQSISSTIFPINIEVHVNGQPFTEFDYGKIVNIHVEDKNSNTLPDISESIEVFVTSTRDPSGISLTLEETGPDTGIFGGNVSTLIFTDGDDQFPSTAVLTIFQQDSSADVDPTKIDTSTVVLTSTSDPTGISVDLQETGPSSKTFSKNIQISHNPSKQNSQLQVSKGDIVSVTSGFFKSNSLVVPNPNPSKGSISVDFVNSDTITISFLGESKIIEVDDSADPGGGGGGLVRPGLVVNALAGFGGGSAYSSPTLTLNNLVKIGIVDVPLEVEDMIYAHDATVPTPAFDSDYFENFNFPLIINEKGFALSGFSTTLETQTLKTNTPHTIKLLFYEEDKIQHFSLYTNLRDANTQIHQSDTQILYFDGQEIQVIDPNGFFENVSFTLNEIDDFKKEVVLEITFANPMKTTDVIIRSWDPYLNSFDTYILDAIKVVPEQEIESPLTTYEEPVIQQLQSQTIPIWIKNNAAWWSEQQIADSDFVAGIEYLIKNGIINVPGVEVSTSSTTTEIPDWIKNNAAWWSDSLVSDKEFLDAMQWLVANGVIQI